MRRHAKASTGKSTQFQAFTLGLLSSVVLLALGAANATAAAPTIPVTSLSGVTATSAVLEADVDPEGEATTYHFEYGLADCSANACTSVPIPNESVGSNSTARRVLEEVVGLQSDTTYHFRAVAANGSGTVAGPVHTFHTYAPPTVTSCPNDVFRVGPAATLPDCRAYEMVSPIDKNGGGIITQAVITGYLAELNQSSLDGEKFTYSSNTAFGDAAGGYFSNQYLATRTQNGWSTHGLNPLQKYNLASPTYDEIDKQFKAFTPDLSSAWLSSYAKTPLTPDAVLGERNLYRRDNTSESYKSLVTSPPLSGHLGKEGGLEGSLVAAIGGHTPDGGHVLITSRAQLTPDAHPATNEEQLYHFHDGELELVSILPDGSANPTQVGSGFDPDPQGLNGERVGDTTTAISVDGSRIFWSANTRLVEDRIFVRIDGQTTVPISESVAENAVFHQASLDGSKVLFSARENDGNHRLYESDVDSEAPILIAAKSHGVVGGSDDLSYVYFVSTEALDAGAVDGSHNLYLRHGGTNKFIATLSPFDVGIWPKLNNAAPSITERDLMERRSRVTPDGHQVAFMSWASLTGYDNLATNGELAGEVYVYDADTDELVCASCNPSDARPQAKPLLRPFRPREHQIYTNINNTERAWVAAWLTTAPTQMYQPRALSDDGSRLFFNSFDPLVPADNNGAQDVYQWERQGSGTCQEAGGCVHLISSGQDPNRSEFVDATPTGDEIFFSTEDSLNPDDPGLRDIYVARIGGGFPTRASAIPCEGDSCQAIPAPPNDPTPASATFRGEGDPKPQVRRRRARKCRAKGVRAGKSQVRQLKAKSCRRANRRPGR